MLYNVLNFPAGVVPVSVVTEADEEELKHYQGCCDDSWDRTLKQVRDMESGGADFWWMFIVNVAEIHGS